jgi:hypothetical protein
VQALAPEVCTPASNDKDEGNNESSGTLKPAREAIDPRKVNPTCRLMINTSSLIRHFTTGGKDILNPQATIPWDRTWVRR